MPVCNYIPGALSVAGDEVPIVVTFKDVWDLLIGIDTVSLAVLTTVSVDSNPSSVTTGCWIDNVSLSVKTDCWTDDDPLSYSINDSSWSVATFAVSILQ